MCKQNIYLLMVVWLWLALGNEIFWTVNMLFTHTPICWVDQLSMLLETAQT